MTTSTCRTMVTVLLFALCALPAQTVLAQPGLGEGPGSGPPQFEDLDKDGNGQITREEYDQFHQARRERMGSGGPGSSGPGAAPVFGGPDRFGRRGGGAMRQRERGSDASFFTSKPIAKDPVEQKVLDVLTDMDQTGRRMQSVPMDDGRFLRLLAEATNAKNVVEIGTSQGMSAIWSCLALRQTGGKLTTYEIDPERANIAQGNFKRAGVEDIVTLVLGDAHEEVVKFDETIDILFLDADKSGYVDYLNKLLPKLRPGGLVVAHNITPGMADPAYVDAITTNPELESLLIHLQAGGISVSMKKR